MAKLSINHQKLVIQLSNRGLSTTEILRELNKIGIQTSRHTVLRTIRSFADTHSLQDKKRSGRPPAFQKHHKRFLDNEQTSNRELTARKLAGYINERFGTNFSPSTIKRVRINLGWVATKTHYGQMIRHVNKAARLAFAINVIRNQDNLKDAIFTDESSFQLENVGSLQFRKKN